MKRKAQISTDFMIALGISLVVLVSLFAVADKRNSLHEAASKALVAKQEADRVASVINQVFLAGRGTHTTLALAPTLQDGTNYTLSIFPEHHRLAIYYDSHTYSAALLTGNISGNLAGIRGSISIINNGGITIE